VRSKLQQQLLALLLCLPGVWIVSIGSIWAQDADYQTAVSLVQQRQFDRAFPILQQILDRSPNDLKARNLMGIALSATGRREEANQHFKQALALDPQFVPALKNLAINELALGLTQDARLHFEAALKLAPRDASCHRGLADIAFASREFELAAIHYEQSGDLARKDSAAAIRFAASCLEAKQPEKAVMLLEQIPTDTDLADVNIQFQAGVLLARLEKFGDAARRFELAQKGFPDRYQAGYNLTLVLTKNGDYEAAIRTGEGILAAGYRKAELYNLLAQAYEQRQRTNQAYDALREATKLEPGDETNYLDLVALCLRHENYDLGLEIAEVGIRLIPGSHRLRLDRGVVLVMKNRLDDAIREFQAAGELAPSEPLPWVAAGLALIQMDRQEEAIKLLHHQSERFPENARITWLLGEALSRSDENGAINALEQSIRLDPRLPQPRALLGKILMRRREFNRAARELEKAVELDPQDMTVTYQLAQALQRTGDTARAKILFEKVEQSRSDGLQPAQRQLLQMIKDRSK
jgi:tetratricopeptide (TPR) repeat protein